MKLIVVIILLLTFSINAQIFVEKNLEESINYLVDFINSDNFIELKKYNSDLDLIDTLFLRAIKFNNYDYSEALLSLTFVTLPFQKMPLHIPFTKITFALKLPSGADEQIPTKINNLPKNIFIDSPKTNFGDKDKVAHFFGNAYLAYSISIFNLSKFLSIFVELFEDAFKVKGGIDNRDFIANHLGYLFGKELLKNPNSLPSQSLKLYPTIKENYLKNNYE
ncbi:MAG: hypothetical protein L3J41_01545 [Melioribacteraceae bacterium]|nr:hypothetical protein [Melioribacteraceae bacterium]